MLNFVDLSVIIPFYKGNKHINHLLCSLNETQKSANMLFNEIIIVNDSPEEEIKIDKLNKDSLKIKIISNPTNYGIHRSRVEGLKYAISRYVLMIDQDDMLSKTALSIIAKTIKVSKFDMYIFNAYHRKYYTEKMYSDTLNIPLNFPKKIITSLYTQLIIGNQIISPGQVIIRKEAIPKAWYQNILTQNGSDDFLLWLMLYRSKCDITYINIPIYYHVEYGGNFSNNEIKMLQSDYAILEILKRNNFLTKWQQYLFMRKNQYIALRIEHSLRYNLKVIGLYPDMIIIRVLFKCLLSLFKVI